MKGTAEEYGLVVQTYRLHLQGRGLTQVRNQELSLPPVSAGYLFKFHSLKSLSVLNVITVSMYRQLEGNIGKCAVVESAQLEGIVGRGGWQLIMGLLSVASVYYMNVASCYIIMLSYYLPIFRLFI
jgi:hypothetical protein